MGIDDVGSTSRERFTRLDLHHPHLNWPGADIVGTAGRTLARRQLMNAHPVETEALLTPSEVATLFRVDPKTVTRWAKAGKLSSIRTLGGHRRYRESEVRDLLNGVPQQRPSDG